MVHVYLCDDVPELRQLLRFVLEEDEGLMVVGEAGEAEIGIEEIAELQPHIVLLVLSMPGMERSSSTTFGCSSAISSMPISASPVSPTTSSSGSSSKMILRRWRNSGTSSHR